MDCQRFETVLGDRVWKGAIEPLVHSFATARTPTARLTRRHGQEERVGQPKSWWAQ
jgi:hypothetical protein